jgi:hypothetical protein
MLLAYLIDPARSEYLLDDLAAEYAVEAVAEPEAEEETARLVRHALTRDCSPLLDRVRGAVKPLTTIGCHSRASSADAGGRRHIGTYRWARSLPAR